MKPGWAYGRIKWDTRMTAGGTPSTDKVDYWLDGDDTGGIPFVAIADMSRRQAVTATAKRLSRTGFKSRTMPIGDPGTILLAMYASVGEVSRLGIRATWNQAILGISPDRSRVDPKFLVYYLLSARDQLLSEVRSNTQNNLNAGQVGDLWYLRPPLVEQSAIADFLDRETAQIDTLIAKQKQLIETLRERRATAITQSVLARGHAQHDLRRISEVIDCAHVTAEFVDADKSFPVASIRECQGRTVDLSDCKYTTQKYWNWLRGSGRSPRLGDLLFIRNVSVGLVSVVTEAVLPFAVGQETVLIRPSNQVDPWFLQYALSSQQSRFQLEGVMVGSTFRRINVATVRALSVPVPSISEQLAIVRKLDAMCSRIDALIAKAEQFNFLAKERRAALITAAVTGQIDVSKAA